MSKQIDWSQPLSAEDAAYVQDRPWLLEDARLQGIEVDFADESDETETETPDGGQSTTDPSQTEIEPEEAEDDESEDTDEEDEDLEEEDEDEEDVPPYSEWEYDALKVELKNRKLPTTGKKPELVARLEEDDQK